MRMRRAAARAGYTLMLALMAAFIVLAFAATMGSLIAHEVRSDRQRRLEAQAAQVISSAMSWARVHPGELRDGAVVALPLGELVGGGLTGSAELRGAGRGAGLWIMCEVRLECGGQRLTRRAEWARQ
ncbi:MAG: hypothetical protein CHACPFDD_03422 [Phycisphaerae bacterium]|nr:hypothetical protein [Phycisphaerae bacterium]